MVEGVFIYKTQGYMEYGSITIKVSETEKSYIFTMIEDSRNYKDDRIAMMFGDNSKITIKKEHSKHAIKLYNDFFVLYPYRDGIPYLFEKFDPGKYEQKTEATTVSTKEERMTAIIKKARSNYYFNQCWNYDYLIGVINDLISIVEEK